MKNIFLIIKTTSILVFLATLITVFDSNVGITKKQFQYLLFSSLIFIIMIYLSNKYEKYLNNLAEENIKLEDKRKDRNEKLKKIWDAERIFYSYVEYYEKYPLSSEEIRNEKKLPYSKSEIIDSIELLIKENPILKNEFTLEIISDLAFYKKDIPEEGYISILSYLGNIKDTSRPSIKNLSKIISEDDFPRDLFKKCLIEKYQIKKDFINSFKN